MKNFIEARPLVLADQKKPRPTQPGSSRGLLFCLFAFVLCVLVSIAPLNRLAGTSTLHALPTTSLLIAPGSWLPTNFWPSSNTHAAQMSTHVVLFLALVTLEFALYALSVYWLYRQPYASDYRRVIGIIWLGTIVCSLIFFFTPAMLSHDTYVYAGYGRLLVAYHANPYFVPLASYPQDPLVHLDDWSNALAAYGPLWLVVTAVCARLAGHHALDYVLLYRTLGLIAQWLNMLLVSVILRSMGRSAKTIALGTLLYAWNPLTLQESVLGAHMDICMLTLMLLGIYACIRAEQDATLHLVRGYVPPLLAFLLATLIKFTAVPLVLFLLVLLARKTLQPEHTVLSLRRLHTLRWRLALRVLIPALLISAAVTLVFYLPFWLGHSIPAIIASFTAPPSASLAYGSILQALLKWAQLYPTATHGSALLRVFLLHQTWQTITIIMLVAMMAIGIWWLWQVPTTRTLALASIGVLGMLLIVTCWFFPWYVLWIVGPAVICLPVGQDRVGRAWIAFTLAFTASAHCIYLFAHGYPPVGSWIGFTCLTTIAPPLFALLFFLLRPIRYTPDTSIITVVPTGELVTQADKKE